jgi:glycerate-2-kinase
MSLKILNKKELTTTPLRKDALSILFAGLKAVETAHIVKEAVKRTGDILFIHQRQYHLREYRRIFIVGVGKAAYEAAKALESILGSWITDGVILDVNGGPLKHMKSLVGTHPLPSFTNIRATAEIIGILKGVDSKDLVLVIVSGGGSALLCWPHQLTCDDMANITQALMNRGATIQELNTVRKHTSEIQGGQLARLAYPATVVGLIFSDVPGDDLSCVASGPTVLDTTTVKDAQRILKKYHVLQQCQLAHCDLRETPKDPVFFSHVTNELMVSNKVAVEAMNDQAQKLGYNSNIYSLTFAGEARESGKLFASLAKPGEALVAAGETTVTIQGDGKGGRNQEFVLGALEALPDQSLILSCASDGIDNSPVAGAFADDLVKASMRRKHLEGKAFLDKNNSFSFFQKTNTAIKTGKTGINISDLMVCLAQKKSKKG